MKSLLIILAKAPFIHDVANVSEIPSDLLCFEELNAQGAT